jgi:penicillin-binding protein 1C
MDGVSGVTGAGPLLRRAVMLTAQRYPPGVLPTPATTGAVPLRVCRLSGLRAGAECPGVVEWFAPGTEPGRECDWHRGGETRLPAQYAEWADQAGFISTSRGAGATGAALLIVSPQDGDRYEVPPGTQGRYATIALRAAGGTGAIAWWVDGRPVSSPRWRLVPGVHTIRAVSKGGQSRAVQIEVAGARSIR